MITRLDDLSTPAVQSLLAEHLKGMADHSPPTSIHALDIEGLRAPDVTFWSVWDNEELLGCGALREIDTHHGEIKSMRTAAAHLGKGVGSFLLEHLIKASRERGYQRISLETGSGPAFEPAHSLYLKFGFSFCGPFGDYKPDPFSRFMTRTISGS